MTATLSTILVQGSDAEKFLQGQLTCDIRNVDQNPSLLGAYCNQQGRAQATLRLLKTQDIYSLILPVEMVQPTLALLKKYAIFSKIAITEGEFFIGEVDWQLKDILSGIATIYPKTAGLFTPNMLNYPALGGVSFDKGCYLGQEVIARTHYLGAPKKQLYKAQIPSHQFCAPGDIIYTETAETAGMVMNVAFDNHDFTKLLLVLSITLAAEPLYLANQTRVEIL